MDLVTHAIDFHQGLSWFRRNENASEMRNHERVEEDSIRSNLLGKLPQSDGALGFHTKGQGHRQGIGRIKLRSGLQSEHSLNHFGNSHFTGIAISNDGLLDFSGCYFKYGQARCGSSYNGRSSCLSHDSGNLAVLCVEQTLDCANGGMMTFNSLSNDFVDFCQTRRKMPLGGAGDHPRLQCSVFLPLTMDDPKAGATQ